MKFLFPIALFLLLPETLVDAYNVNSPGFTYADDAACAYPFDDFTIESISCESGYTNKVVIEGVSDNDGEDDGETVCHAGDRLEVHGQVTTVEAVSKYFTTHVNVCFETRMEDSRTWYGTQTGERCTSYEGHLDLRGYTVNNNNYEEAEADYYYQDEDDYDSRNQSDEYLPTGTYPFSAVFQLPRSSHSRVAGVKVTFSLHPRKKYLGPQINYNADGYNMYLYNGLPWHKYKTDCTATFVGTGDYTTNRRVYYAYGAAAITMVLASVGLGAVLIKKRKISCACTEDFEPDEDKQVKEAHDAHSITSISVYRRKNMPSLLNQMTFESTAGDDSSVGASFVEMGSPPNEMNADESVEVTATPRRKRVFPFFRRQ